MSISKGANDVQRFRRPAFSFANARSALKAFLEAREDLRTGDVLLPAYVGWSKNEGSGVFDPIAELGLKYRFYRMTRQLTIDVNDLKSQLAEDAVKLLVVIHYFGYPDPNLREVLSLAREHGVPVVEDEAHALYSDWFGGICGRWGSAAIFSLHKMLPFRRGGLLVLNDPMDSVMLDKLADSPHREPLEQNPLDYDLLKISGVRRLNARKLLDLVAPLKGSVDPLFPDLPDGVVPQTLPILIGNKSRDDLYFRLNDRGFGVVSLYHTLISPIQESAFPDSHWLARRILNLPVHQDASLCMLEAMVAYLSDLVAA